MKNVIIIGLCLSLIGCVPASSQIMKPYANPQYGMTKRHMFDLLGKPDSIEIYQKSDQTRMEFYIYVRKYQSTQEKVPVCVVGNKIVGWGKSFYEDHVSPDDIRIK